ncbi:MAG: hypothetical protein FWE39_17780 [Nocardiaceae bacterium]|nr:hypothetical protein [Nocardiaceae bacterium]
MTPETDPAKAKPTDVAETFIGPTNIAALGENLAVFEKLADGVDSAVTVGSLIGTVVGALIGCVAGGSTGPAMPAACIGGIATGAGVGGVIGTIVAGVPVLAYNGWQVYQTLNAAPAAPAPAAG